MKTILKNKRNYRTKIGRLGNDVATQDLLSDQARSSGSQGHGDEVLSDEGYSNNDENNESGSEEEDSTTGSAGMKRKATGSGESGERGKQRKV